MPGARNPLVPSMARILNSLNDVVSTARSSVHDASSRAKEIAEEKMLDIKIVDVSIQFIGASGLPKMDLVGSADPYFVAKLDDRITFVSTVQSNTLTPVWNETWNVKNVPSNAVLKVEVIDKDEGSIHDDYIGKFETTISAGSKEVEIVSTLLKQVKGTFWLKVTTTPSEQPHERHYTFDGPIRFTRHFSPTIGRLTNLNDERLYSTWKMHIKGVPLFFGDLTQHWNLDYRAAQTIFGRTPTSLAVRSSIQAGHRMLYARTTRNGFGTITSHDDVFALLRGGPTRGASASASAPGAGGQQPHRIKPAVYTYIISAGDDTFRFSETGAAFFVDFASKHALHANCAARVRYAGEFHPRPAGGWAAFRDTTPDEAIAWELVIDNNSGTYAPDAARLPDLQALLEYNFPGFRVVALDFHDPELERSREDCRAYALKYRGVKQNELQPHTSEGEETLQHVVINTPVSEMPEEAPWDSVGHLPMEDSSQS